MSEQASPPSPDEKREEEASNPDASPEAKPEVTSEKSVEMGETQKPPAQPDAPAYRPNYVFLAVVSIVSLALDLGTKQWAKGRLENAATYAERRVVVIKDLLAFTFARNRGGAW